MRWFFGIKFLIRMLILLGREVQAGNPYALALLAILIGAAVLTVFLRFARRPLGGDPEKPPIDESLFRDDANPYRRLN